MRLLQRQFFGRITALAIVAAAVWVHTFSELPADWLWYSLWLLVVLGGVVCWRIPASAYVMVPLMAAAITLWWVSAAADQRLAETLPTTDENRVSRVEFEVIGLPQQTPSSLHFTARVRQSKPEALPSTIQVNWSAATWLGPYSKPVKVDFPTVSPGQVWQSNMLVKTPHGYQNEQGFDYEQYSFSHGVRALGSVRGEPKLLFTLPWWQRSWSVMAQSLRYELRKAMLPYVQSYRYGGVLLALSVGDQNSIQSQDWLVFNRAGLTHLVSISGSHVTLMAVLVATVISWCWRRLRYKRVALAEYWPAQKIAACVALLVAALYCTVAGWGVPAQRTFLMLAVVVGTRLASVSWQPSQTLALAAVLVVCLDPWTVVASGFWLSFGAVTVLLLCYHWQGHAMQPKQGWAAIGSYVLQVLAWQVVISLALFPALGWQFHEISLISPFSNAYAIPLIGMVITPLSLLLMLVAPIEALSTVAQGVAWLAHVLLELMMRPTEWLCELPAASMAVAWAPWWTYGVAALGMGYAFLPKGLPGRHWGWIGLLPCLLWGRTPIAEGEWRADVLDIGQGGAVLVQTRHHALLFDTGLRLSHQSDVGDRVIVPFLRAKGITALDWLVLSHDDLDHTGGALSVLQAVPVRALYTSFSARAYFGREAALLGMVSPLLPTTAQHLCQQGVSWLVDGVQFSFVWPDASALRNKDSNARSCVLSIRSAQGKSLLLTGDIGVAQEAALLRQGLEPHDVVVVGHHGSRTSSSVNWVQSMQATWAIAQVGWGNRFGHPHTEVVRRWQRFKSVFIRTDYAGAVRIVTEGSGIQVQCQRQVRARYWQHPSSALQTSCDQTLRESQ
ncbi:DNA internalization-related competence protein ComEC/Rec2 [Paenalcaligenes sp. Me52]|uniref:DNA internalization-related competence protein ComEC/Rec2 n=1 Tax=Paenalcaligenes sp. Me52 TaxID=3392038 RepID=UPI003D2CA7C9